MRRSDFGRLRGVDFRDLESEAVVRRLVAAWNAHDFDAVASCLSIDFENHQLPLGVTIGRDRYLDHLAGWYRDFPDLQVELRACFGFAGTVCAEVRESGRRARPRGDSGDESGGERETFFGCDLFEVRDGRIVVQRGYWDYSVATGRLAPLAGGHGPGGSRYFQPL
jgi:limonene-1,2-epoxide hydrolase